MNLDKRSWRLIIVTAIITAVIVIVIMGVVAWSGFKIFVNSKIDGLAKTVQQQCADDPVLYRGKVHIPMRYTRYNKKLATILWDIGGAVSTSNCKEIPMPEPFNRSKRLVGQTDGDSIMYGHIFWNDENPRIDYCCLIFSGTYYTEQWNENLNVNLCPAEGLNGTSPDTQIHSGFLGMYMSVRDQVWDWILANRSKVKWIIVAGRSLGGALSTICSYDIARKLAKWKIELMHYTFASPRVGNPTFAKEFNARVANGFRIYNTEDVVIDLPPPIWRDNVYQHVSLTSNNRIFTVNHGNLNDNHIEAYRELPN
jgi:hypothetical protein